MSRKEPCTLPGVDAIKALLRGRLPSELYLHSERVSATAGDLLEKHAPEEAERGKLAGILHDIAKPLDSDALLSKADEFGILTGDIERKNPVLLHAKVGAEIARRTYGVSDDTVLGAIRWHTVGRASMSECEMAVYLADLIEPERNYPGVEEVRLSAARSLARGCLDGVSRKIVYVIERGRILDPSSVAFYNWLLGGGR